MACKMKLLPISWSPPNIDFQPLVIVFDKPLYIRVLWKWSDRCEIFLSECIHVSPCDFTVKYSCQIQLCVAHVPNCDSKELDPKHNVWYLALQKTIALEVQAQPRRWVQGPKVQVQGPRMMSSEKFCLQWKEFQENVKHSYKEVIDHCSLLLYTYHHDPCLYPCSWPDPRLIVFCYRCGEQESSQISHLPVKMGSR